MNEKTVIAYPSRLPKCLSVALPVASVETAVESLNQLDTTVQVALMMLAKAAAMGGPHADAAVLSALHNLFEAFSHVLG